MKLKCQNLCDSNNKDGMQQHLLFGCYQEENRLHPHPQCGDSRSRYYCTAKTENGHMVRASIKCFGRIYIEGSFVSRLEIDEDRGEGKDDIRKRTTLSISHRNSPLLISAASIKKKYYLKYQLIEYKNDGRKI